MSEANRTLNEQMELLHREVTEIASIMANTYATEKAIDQKATVIGRALVAQKETVRTIQDNQSEQTDLMVECDNRQKDRQREVLMTIADVAQSLANLEDTEVKKDLLVNSLERLSEEQSAFMEENRKFSKKALEDVAEIRTALLDMKQVTENMDIPDQVRFINAKVEEMKKALAAYTEKRSKITAAMAQQTQETASQIEKIASLMETQRTEVSRIAAISEEYGNKTVEMCQLLSQILDEVRSIRDQEEEAPSLEDLFGEQPKEEEVLREDAFDDASEEELEAEATEEDDAAEPSDEEEPEGGYLDDEDDEDLDDEDLDDEDLDDLDEDDRKPFVSEPDDGLTFVDQDGGKSVQRRKKGFFARLFGGK